MWPTATLHVGAEQGVRMSVRRVRGNHGLTVCTRAYPLVVAHRGRRGEGARDGAEEATADSTQAGLKHHMNPYE